jgi:replicative DNA helicase
MYFFRGHGPVLVASEWQSCLGIAGNFYPCADWRQHQKTDRKGGGTSMNNGSPPVHEFPVHQVGEKGLLGSLILDSSIYLENAADIDPQLFWTPANRIIFKAVRDLAPNFDAIDFSALRSALSAGELEEIGGVSYLDEVFAFVPTAKNWRWYYDQAFSAHRLRQAHLAALEILKLEDNTDEALAAAEQALKSIAEPGAKEPVPFRERVRQTEEWIEGLATSPPQSVVQFGISALDSALLPIERGDQLVLGAETGGGKSALASQLILSSTDKKFAVFSVEMLSRSLVARMFAAEGRIGFSKLRQGRLTEREAKRFRQAKERLISREIWIEDDQPIDIRLISAKCRRFKRKGLDVVVVDYLQLVAPIAGKRDSSREREVAEISRSLKTLALELDVVVIALSQLNDDGRLRESRAIGQDADIVLQIRHGDEGAAIHVLKHRNGPRGSIPVTFDGATLRFSDVENRAAMQSGALRLPYSDQHE